MTRQTRCTGGSTPDACHREPTGVRDGEPMCAEHMRIWDEIFGFLSRDPYNGPDGIGYKGDVDLNQLASTLCGSRIADAKRKLLAYLKDSGPMAAEPASRACGLDPDYGSPRLSTLITDGLVQVVDRKGVSDRGNACGRYALTALGRSVLEQLREAA